MTEPGPDEVAFHDQVDAAAADLQAATQLGHALAIATGYAAGPVSIMMPTTLLEDLPWAARGWHDTFEPWLRGEGRTCIHNPNLSHPQPVWGCAWKPGLVVCGECLHLFDVATMAEDRTCDGCGRVVGGPENGDPIYSTAVQHEFMAYRIGVCTDCFAERWRT